MRLSAAKKYRMSNMMLAFVILLAVIIIVAIVGFFILTPDVDTIQGEAEVTKVRVSGKLPGRIVEIRVSEGDQVRAGDTLAMLESPEVHAKLQQALAAKEAAQAQNMKAIKGARQEVITSAYEMWQKALAGVDIAEKSYKRVQNLYDKGVMSAQKRDEAEANYHAAVATEKAALAQYEMAKNGAEAEDRIAASALVDKAKGAIAEVESYLQETAIIAQVDGEVLEIYPEVGELVGTGSPVIDLIALDNMWVTFNVREDLLKEMKIGASISTYIPALDLDNVSMKIYYMKDMGVYAAWKATKTTGQYDLKTFEVRARPDSQIDGLRPGMSVILK